MSKKEIEITFVNTVAVTGFLNGVVNVAFATAQFIPAESADGTKVDVAEFISANLRMDLACAQQLRDGLDKIIQQNTKPAVKEMN